MITASKLANSCVHNQVRCRLDVDVGVGLSTFWVVGHSIHTSAEPLQCSGRNDNNKDIFKSVIASKGKLCGYQR